MKCLRSGGWGSWLRHRVKELGLGIRVIVGTDQVPGLQLQHLDQLCCKLLCALNLPRYTLLHRHLAGCRLPEVSAGWWAARSLHGVHVEGPQGAALYIRGCPEQLLRHGCAGWHVSHAVLWCTAGEWMAFMGRMQILNHMLLCQRTAGEPRRIAAEQQSKVS